MPDREDLIKNANIDKIAKEGQKIYDKIKIKYEPEHNGEFLAIEIESEQVYLGKTSAEAVEIARLKHKDKVFYVVKIGYTAADTLAGLFKEWN
ncbi:MAG: hypothetical protein HY959_10385 [Ignavibacteriae bacterium]|nr:hypothetical protein [Ignavibacteriota bacterium]